MEQLLDYLFSGILFCGCIFLLTLCWYMVKDTKNKKLQLELDKYEIDMEIKIEDDLFSILDKVISECFNEYLIREIEYKGVEYVNSELEKKILKEVSHIVCDTISPILINKLSIVYDMDNFAEIVSNRTYLHVLDYVIKKNSQRDDE